MDLDAAGYNEIRIQNVDFHYGSQPVLSDISFTIHSGDFLAIIGPNGSGKTTLVRIILGLLKPDRGRVTIGGVQVREFDEHHRIGYIPQKATAFDPSFPATVHEIVALGLVALRKKIGGGEIKTRVCRALEQVGMLDFHKRRIGELSGGQQQRVLIARAIVHFPRVLFLDEPTTGVDMETQDRFFEMLDSLNSKEKITIVMVTHETGIINKFVRQVACLNRRLVYHGAHDEFCRSSIFRKMLEDGHHVISHRH
jgi:zinc transport system ATP-binding protein